MLPHHNVCVKSYKFWILYKFSSYALITLFFSITLVIFKTLFICINSFIIIIIIIITIADIGVLCGIIATPISARKETERQP